MKKLLLLSVALLALSFSASAQMTKGFTYSEKNTIGLRLGYGVEASYQRTLNNSNRVEADLGYMLGGGFSLAGNYQWGWTIDKVEGLGWYVGPGVGVAFGGNSFFGNVSGQVGLEYSFGIPLSLSVDWRPAVNFGSGVYFGWTSFALGVRYRF